jgi:hypothetical protein
MYRSRLAAVTLAVALLGLLYSREHSRPAKAARDADPNLIWSIGTSDNSGDEFGTGSVRSLTYTCGKSSPLKDWRQRQDADDESPSVYRVRFNLDQPPGPATLNVDGFFLGFAPRALVLEVNEKRGFFRVLPTGGPDLDERQANDITHSRQSFSIPVDASLLRSGANEIGLSFLGKGGAFYYDALSLRRSEAAPAAVDATIEPTIFFPRRGQQIRETVQVVVKHALPLGKASVALKVAGGPAIRQEVNDDYGFGERVLEMEIPAPAGEQQYELNIAADGRTYPVRGTLRPEKRWRIFAGLKIHNDIGYTDLQPHVQELDNRNTDGVLDIVSKFPFYKFNFETGWLAENYLHSRQPERTRQFMAMAARDQIGVNAMYLNLMTGMCTGEELYRSLYFTKGLQRKFGIPMKFACLTDAPSHSWFVPTLLADAGVKGFANGSNQTRAPLLEHSSLNEDSPFWWEGADGRRVMAWFARSYLQLARLAGDQQTLERLRRTVPQFLARYRRNGYPVDAVLLYGLFTDNADIRSGDAEIIKEWNDTYAFPKITPATDADYYAYLAEHWANRLPTFRGDAGSYWEDGAGSTAAETTMNRDTQRLLPVDEMAAALASAFHPGERYPADEFQEAWKNLMFYDEHTWGASRSISQPGRQLVTDQWEFKRAYAARAHWAAKDLLYRSLNRLVQNISIDGQTMFVFNPDIWPRTDIVQMELEPSREVFDLTTGKALTLDVVSEQDGYQVLRFLAKDVPGMGYRAYGVRPGKKRAMVAPNQPPALEAESRYYRIVLDPKTGGVAHLIDKELNRDLVDAKAPYRLNELLYVSGGENSRILRDQATYTPPDLDVAGQTSARVVENVRTPFGSRIVVRAEAKNVPAIESEIDLYDDLKRVDITNRIRKTETRAKEAVYFAFPFAVSPPEIAYEGQNTWIRPNTDQLPGACRDWFATQNLVVARDAGAAIAWATPDAPLITLTDINRGLWLKHLDVKNAHVFSYAMNNYWFTNYKAAQGGEFTFRYSLTSGKSLGEPELAQFDAGTRSPLIGYAYYDTGNVRLHAVERAMPAATGSFLAVDAPNAQVTSFKQAEDGNGYILRLRETAGHAGRARISTDAFRLTGAFRCDGVEDNEAALTIKAGAVEAPLRAHAFTTVRLILQRREARSSPNLAQTSGQRKQSMLK